MTISDLISTLIALQEKHGDLPVHRPDIHVVSWPVRTVGFEAARTVDAPDPYDPPVVHPDCILIA